MSDITTDARGQAVERMARVLCDTDGIDLGYGWDNATEGVRGAYRRLAAAAYDAHPATEAVRRVEALAMVLVDAPGQAPVAAAMIFGALAGGDPQRLDEYERAALAQPGTGDD